MDRSTIHYQKRNSRSCSHRLPHTRLPLSLRTLSTNGLKLRRKRKRSPRSQPKLRAHRTRVRMRRVALLHFASAGTNIGVILAPTMCVICAMAHLYLYLPFVQGPWLQLPIELLESLMVINMDPATLRQERHWHPEQSYTEHLHTPLRLGDRSYSEESRLVSSHSSSPIPSFTFSGDTPAPPPIDPGVFQSMITIRQLIDEASELSVRASSGLSAAALGSLRGT
jgi:hypothetical protein